MTTADCCPRCGAELTAGAPLDLCPACLLRAGLAAPTDGPTGDTASGDGEATTYVAQPARRPQLGAALGTPDRVGPFHILGVLGEGGMGIVYLAEQREPILRRVALKLVKPGMDSREVLRRFEAERQALALMDHPHIARVLDAGIGPAGTPYFVMEYVPGLTITDYCDRHRLSNTERLELFLPVCAAIQHAHQKGVIHRDLKPSNILVTVQDGKPVPKVIDFGIAKATYRAMTEQAAFTTFGTLIGTPEYMSPEQAEPSGLGVDTTTDIYSLGVILYELLVGALPFDAVALRQAGLAEIHRIIREQDPPKPSTRASTLGATAEEVAKRHRTSPGGLERQVRGDLDAITMKALEKDRTRRYASASEFAADVHRYLTGEAVVARPASVAYRTKKFVRRHRVGVAAGALVAGALVIGLATTSAMYVRADRSEREARHRACEANMASARLFLQMHDTKEAKLRLAACEPAVRDWYWHSLAGEVDSSAATLRDAGSIPEAGATLPGFRIGSSVLVRAAPDGSRVVALAAKASLKVGVPAFNPSVAIWNSSDLRLVARYEDDGIEAVTADGDALLVSQGASYRVLRRASKQVVAILEGIHPSGPDFPGITFVFSEDGRWIGSSEPVRVWDARTGQLAATLTGHQGLEGVLAFSPDGSLLASASGSPLARDSGSPLAGRPSQWTARIWSVRNRLKVAELEGHDGYVNAVAFSPDGTRVATGSSDRTVRVWDVASASLLQTMRGHEARVSAVAFSPDGKKVVSGSADNTVRLWHIATGRQLECRHGHERGVVSVVFMPGGDRVVSGSADGTVRLWNVGIAARSRPQ